MNLEELKNKLRNYGSKDIIFTTHSELQALMRNVDLEEVKNNILNPEKLVFAERQEIEILNKEKYACYFAYSPTYCHEYVLTLNRKIIIVTIIVINRDWQKIIEGKKK